MNNQENCTFMIHDFLCSASVELTYVISNEMSQQLLDEYVTWYRILCIF